MKHSSVNTKSMHEARIKQFKKISEGPFFFLKLHVQILIQQKYSGFFYCLWKWSKTMATL